MAAYFTGDYEENLFYGRYADPEGEETTWEDVFERVSFAVAPSDRARMHTQAMRSAVFIPGSPQLWNYGAIGRRYPRNGSSCFTLHMGDTLEDFRRADADAEAVYVASGGAGFLGDMVRPRTCRVRHCSEGAMGSMCAGGPILRIESTTGYITGSGRARGAMMIQLGIGHPDVVEFILAKRPTPIGWVDDWVTNAKAVTRHDELANGIHYGIDAFSTAFVHRKDWPHVEEAERVSRMSMAYAVGLGIIQIDGMGRCVPMVMDWALGRTRPANRDWTLPLQNCNMSIRCSDAFMEAVATDGPWALSWFDWTPPKPGEQPWTRTDYDGQMREVEDGRRIMMDADGSTVISFDENGPAYRYGVVVTTWEGLVANLSPNKNQWRDSDYARFYRNIIIPSIGNLRGKITARQLWKLVCENAWNHGDPGVVFSDTYERFQPVDSAIYGPRLSNPCSEYTNSAGGSCNLVSVNLRECARRATAWNAALDPADRHSAIDAVLAEIGEASQAAFSYIADAMEHNIAPVEYVDRLSREHFRTVGVGIMGLAELLMELGVVYGTPEAENIAAIVMSEVALACWEGSFAAASEGAAVPKGWDSERMGRIFDMRHRMSVEDGLPTSHRERWATLALRAWAGECASHTAVTSVAPTGTISQIAGWTMSRMLGVPTSVTSGIEPVFRARMRRQDNSGATDVIHDMADHPAMITADEVSPSAHVRMQAAVCRYVCMSASKTINLPERASIEDVSDAYRLAWQLGVPGTAVYRHNSKPMQVLTALDCPSGDCSVEGKEGAPEAL